MVGIDRSWRRRREDRQSCRSSRDGEHVVGLSPRDGEDEETKERIERKEKKKRKKIEKKYMHFFSDTCL